MAKNADSISTPTLSQSGHRSLCLVPSCVFGEHISCHAGTLSTSLRKSVSA